MRAGPGAVRREPADGERDEEQRRDEPRGRGPAGPSGPGVAVEEWHLRLRSEGAGQAGTARQDDVPRRGVEVGVEVGTRVPLANQPGLSWWCPSSTTPGRKPTGVAANNRTARALDVPTAARYPRSAATVGATPGASALSATRNRSAAGDIGSVDEATVIGGSRSADDVDSTLPSSSQGAR